MKNTQRQPSELLQEFLNYIDQVKSEYEMAHEAVGKEDKRLQDFLHELEFAKDRSERNKVSTKFQKSRRERRRQKDEVQRLELLVEFFNNDGTVSGIGVVKWYKVGGSAPIATAKTLTVSAADVTNAQAYTCQLED